ncbi:MAG: hypothetical protein ACFFD2_19800 [Promethearchaeota archaeon]
MRTITRGGKRLGSGRPRKRWNHYFQLDRTLDIPHLISILSDYNVEEDGIVFCYFCIHYSEGTSEFWNDEKCDKKCIFGKGGRHYLHFNESSSLYNFFQALLKKKYLCVICTKNHPTKKVIYRCEYQEDCDLYPRGYPY